MTTNRTFSEMLYGDTLWHKYQGAVNRETISRMTPSHYTAHAALVDALRTGMGYGKGMHAKRKMMVTRNVVAEINKRHPALAAEYRVSGAKAERSIAAEMKRLREWKKMNWAHYYGRGTR